MIGMTDNGLECIVCAEPLHGRQRLYCCGRCKKRAQRDPERYPKPEPIRRQPPATAIDPPSGAADGDHGPPDDVVRVPSGVAKAAATGNRATVMAALRDRLASEIDICVDQRALASLTARLVDVLDRTDSAPATGTSNGGGALDEIARRRAAREARREPTA